MQKGRVNNRKVGKPHFETKLCVTTSVVWCMHFSSGSVMVIRIHTHLKVMDLSSNYLLLSDSDCTSDFFEHLLKKVEFGR